VKWTEEPKVISNILKLKAMKIFYLCAMLAFFTACDSENPEGNGSPQANKKKKYTRIGYPANPNNAYDAAGRLFYDIAETYYLQNLAFPDVTAIIGGIELVAAANPDFVAVKPAGYIAPTADAVNHLLALKAIDHEPFMSECGLGAAAKASLSGFIANVIDYREQQQGYAAIYNYIVGYEALSAADAGFSEYDKKIVLTTASSARYACYFASKYKRRPDRDWEISWGNIAAATEGAGESTAKAATLAAATAIAANR
jgi:hypothetical protein